MSSYQSGNSNNGQGGDWLSWALIVILFASGIWFLALPLLFVKLFAPDKKKGSSAPPLRQTSQTGGARQSSGAAKNGGRAKDVAQSVTRTPKSSSKSSRLLIIFGAIASVVGLFAAIDPIGSAIFAGELSVYASDILQGLAFLAGGIGMLLGGLSMRRAMNRYVKYSAVIGSLEAMSVEAIAKKLGYSKKQVSKDLQRMIDKGYFGDAAYLNMELGYFFRSGEADAELTAMRSQAERKTQEARKVQQADGYAKILQGIRAANDRIADPVLTEKISRLEDITAKIFKAVEEDPKKRQKIDTFLNYYLPTTQKLLDSYAQFEATGIDSGNLREARERIESTMDSIVSGFEYQLDELYKTDAMDVDSDIQVMRAMLKRDVSSAQQDFHIDPAPAPAPPEVDLGGSAAQEMP